MARYIDADKLFRYVDEQTHLSKGKLAQYIRENKTLDVAEVKHGHWYDIDSDVGWKLVGCSLCGKEYSLCDGEDETDYCPYCGAKMDGRSDT